jgi:class 3 adenylate cyclase
MQVETIGDAYMIASGIPQENGMAHVEELADIAMGIVDCVACTVVVHMPSTYQLRVRVGLCTGPVATGVIGLVAPRFCLFGDTVSEGEDVEGTCIT